PPTSQLFPYTTLFRSLQKILKLLEPTINALKRLWNEGLKELMDFSADAFVDFYELFLKPLGKWALGKGFPMLIDAINNFLKKIEDRKSTRLNSSHVSI